MRGAPGNQRPTSTGHGVVTAGFGWNWGQLNAEPAGLVESGPIWAWWAELELGAHGLQFGLLHPFGGLWLRSFPLPLI